MTRSLIGEDEDDCHLVNHLARKLDLGESKRVPLGGNDAGKLRKRIGPILNEDDPHIIVVLDADRDASATWRRLGDVLASLGHPFPDEVLTAQGLDYRTPGVRISEWVFPDCTSPGEMEDFFLTHLIPAHDGLATHVETTIDTLPTPRRFVHDDLAKARMRTWLAWQRRPGLPPGQALSEGILPVDVDRLGPFAAWLRLVLD